MSVDSEFLRDCCTMAFFFLTLRFLMRQFLNLDMCTFQV